MATSPESPGPSPPQAPPKRTLYGILGVAEDASGPDIEAAYKARVGELQRALGMDTNEFNLVHEAYQLLAAPDKRAAYDAKLLAAAERAAALAEVQSPDLVVEADEGEEAAPRWKNKYVRAGGALVLALAVFWLFRSPPAPTPAAVAPRVRPAASAPPAAPAPAPAAAAPVARAVEDLFAELSRSTARITVHDVSGSATGLGSGVVVGAGAVVTNCHLATAGGAISVKVGAEQFAASVAIADEEYDLCQLSVPGLGAPAFPIGSADSLKVGQKVYALGTPQGLELTISDGIVSALRPLPQGRVIQTSAPMSPGSSGGPLFDAYGQLVGILTFQHRSGQNLNFAVPADWIAQMRERPATNPLLEAMAKSAAAGQ